MTGTYAAPQISKTDRPPDVEPTIRHVVPWRVVSVSAIPGLLLRGAVQWANGADLAPDAMYDAIKAHGRWIVE
jgi:hypothetical protein